MSKRDKSAILEKAGALIEDHPLAAAAVIAGGAALAAGAFSASRKPLPVMEEPIEDDIEQEIAAGAIAY